MDIGKSFTILFEDKDWLKKMLFGGLFTFLSMFLIGIPFLMGYLLRMVKKGIAGEFLPLPEWDDFGGLFKEGLMYSLAIIIYFIILSIVSTILGLIPCLGCILAPLVFLLMPLIMPYITIRYSETNNFGDCFDFNGIYKYTMDNIKNLIIYALMVFVLSMISSTVGTILLGIGILFTNFWFLVGSAFLMVEVDKEAKK